MHIERDYIFENVNMHLRIALFLILEKQRLCNDLFFELEFEKMQRVL